MQNLEESLASTKEVMQVMFPVKAKDPEFPVMKAELLMMTNNFSKDN